jgi:hypothetical protein
MRSWIYVEGKDDLAALTEIYKRFFGYIVQRGEPGQTRRADLGRLLELPAKGHQLEIINGRDRGSALCRAAEHYQERKFRDRVVDRIGLLFDPDSDDDVKWRAAIEKQFGIAKEAPKDDLGGYRLEQSGHVSTLLPVPWEGGDVVDELEKAKRCLERVGLDVLARASPDQRDLVAEMLDLIRSRALKVSWKTGFRLMNAIRAPSTEDGFASQVFGQDEGLREHVRPALQCTMLWKRLSFFADDGAVD